MIAGPVLFAQYAYPPNELGYCGPDDHRALLEYCSEGVVDGGLIDLARGFEGAWPYLQLIAAANGIRDPLDRRVVEAYWIGNRLLERVGAGSLLAIVEDRFRGTAGAGFGALAEQVLTVDPPPVPHHAFHVFCVYPWVGLMRAGWSEQPLRVLDRCRIRWGTVVEAGPELVTVRAPLLRWDGRRLTLGPPVEERVRASSGGRALVGGLRPGDRVSMHWDWVCDRVDAGQAHALRRFTERHLEVVNRPSRPAPAAIIG